MENKHNMHMADNNARVLEREIAWFSRVMDARFNLHFEAKDVELIDIRDIPAPDLQQGDSVDSEYARVLREHELETDFNARLVLMLAMMPHIRPQVLDPLFTKNSGIGRNFTEFGGWTGKTHGGHLPTCETAAFLLAGNDLAHRFAVMRLFEDDHPLIKAGICRISNRQPDEPFFSAALTVTSEYLNRFTTGHFHKPDFSSDFPAKRIVSKLNWSDLVLHPEVMDEIDNIGVWLKHTGALMQDWGLERSVKPGYRCLFHGPPGTGKTLTATLIGAAAGVDVYRIDLSMIVSKYIGETEKNMASVFDQAQNKNWILFFDEADALFGKRTQAGNSNDRHANQEISYLLQRVEDFPGLVILATNLKANIDDAFARRFQASIYFPMPDAVQRLRLWQGLFPDSRRLAADVDLARLADEHELSGGALTNVARYAAIRAIREKRDTITQADLIQGIGRELVKEGRML
ncbi:hypothetical protein GCM10011430_00310 [Oxalicibacterium solurbis]|uniref:AAA+ ATPase domain-containing protein n=2 Tax=Oxalicibacterium solurbis TaxID=69280 RepID=A0A8J3AXH5_9BURK|nr:hypothetical protein GCM10011430_00310 [Oxalicibacterium solurbis]